ncbi:hypothetical protein HDU98_012025 [Podochytrium sp. JEL0797]|nr:hypothetical protein HDU98_012025 [Podochytrium sp. JEL0797]
MGWRTDETWEARLEHAYKRRGVPGGTPLRESVILTLSKTATVAELKQALQVELKDDPMSPQHAVITSGSRNWNDASRLSEMDPEDKGIVKLSCTLLSVDTNKK